MPKRVTASFIKPSLPTHRRRIVKSPDPNKHYRWTRANKVDERSEDYSYEVVPSKTGGAVTSGSDVLMCCRRDQWEDRNRERKTMAEERMRGPIEGFKMQGLKYGVPVIDGSSSRRGPMSIVLNEPDPRIG